jgi:hypothetical protein
MSRTSNHAELQATGVASAPLPVAIVPGMTVVPRDDADAGTICGITEAYCLFRLTGAQCYAVAAWSELALANVCPSPHLLPADVTQNDRRNASAAVLRELLALEQFGLSTAQAAVKDELLRQLGAE